MKKYEMIKIQEHEELKERAADWFHAKWQILKEAYIESMEECLLNTQAVPQWYIAMKNDEIIGGLGVIENDFHDRKEFKRLKQVYIGDFLSYNRLRQIYRVCL